MIREDGQSGFNPIPTGGSKVPTAPKLPSKLRKSKKTKKKPYKFAPTGLRANVVISYSLH